MQKSDRDTMARAGMAEQEAPWRDVEIQYGQDADIVDIYVVHVTPGLIAQTVPLDNGETDVFMDVDGEGRAVAIEFLDASCVFARRFFTETAALDADSRCASLFFSEKNLIPNQLRVLYRKVDCRSTPCLHLFFSFLLANVALSVVPVQGGAHSMCL